MKPQFVSRRRPKPQETYREAGAFRTTRCDAQIFQPVLPPRLLPQELQRNDPQGTGLRPLVPGNMARLAPNLLPDSLLFPARSTEYLQRCHRKRCAPNRAKWLHSLANAQNCDAWRVQSIPTPSGPLQQDYAHIGRDPLPKRAPWLMRAYPSVPSLERSLHPSSLGKRRSLRDSTRIRPNSKDSRQLAFGGLPHKTGRLSNARSEHHALRIVARIQNHPDRRGCMTKCCRPPPLASGHLAPAPASKLVRQSALLPTSCPSGWKSVTDPSALDIGAGDDQASDTRARRARNKFLPRVIPVLAWLLGIAPPARGRRAGRPQ